MEWVVRVLLLRASLFHCWGNFSNEKREYFWPCGRRSVHYSAQYIIIIVVDESRNMKEFLCNIHVLCMHEKVKKFLVRQYPIKSIECTYPHYAKASNCITLNALTQFWASSCVCECVTTDGIIRMYHNNAIVLLKIQMRNRFHACLKIGAISQMQTFILIACFFFFPDNYNFIRL